MYNVSLSCTHTDTLIHNLCLSMCKQWFHPHYIQNVQSYRKSCFPCVQYSALFLPQWKQPSLCFHRKSQDQLVIYSYGQLFNVTSVYMPGTFLNKSLWLDRKIRIHNHRNISDRSSKVLATLSGKHKVFSLWIPQQHQRLQLHSSTKQHRVCFCILVVYVTIALLLNKEHIDTNVPKQGEILKTGERCSRWKWKSAAWKALASFQLHKTLVITSSRPSEKERRKHFLWLRKVLLMACRVWSALSF